MRGGYEADQNLLFAIFNAIQSRVVIFLDFRHIFGMWITGIVKASLPRAFCRSLSKSAMGKLTTFLETGPPFFSLWTVCPETVTAHTSPVF